MLNKSKRKPQTVSEKVTELIQRQNGNESSDDSADEATAPRIEDFDDEYDLPDAQSTDFRKRNVKLLSEQSARYTGKIATRKDLEMDEDEQEAEDDSDMTDDEVSYEASDSDEEENSAALASFNEKLKIVEGKQVKAPKGSDENVNDDSYDDSDYENNGNAVAVSVGEEEEEEDEGAESEMDDDFEEDDDDLENANDSEREADILTNKNQQAEVQKGICVQNQLHIWERMLELRIKAQKLLSNVNQLPIPTTLQTQQTENEELRRVTTETQQNTSKLLAKLIQLQHTLFQQNSEVKRNMTSTLKRTAPTEVSANETDTKRFAEHLNSNFKEFRSYRNTVLLKWDDRTKLLTPGAGAKKKSLQEDYDIIKKIDNTLANRDALIEKSQFCKNTTTKTTANATSGESNAALTDTDATKNVNIYDDSDFYHQQLRELIEYKANTSSNMSEITKQYVELQKLRQKMKKKVDTRASKGRKLRYVVHNKLINFMAPDEASDWTEESKNELCKSLFV